MMYEKIVQNVKILDFVHIYLVISKKRSPMVILWSAVQKKVVKLY